MSNKIVISVDENIHNLQRALRSALPEEAIKKSLSIAQYIAELHAENRLYIKNDKGEIVPLVINGI